jgi:NADP-dependent 3-hydroxy acid dehydrogenase YdfG
MADPVFLITGASSGIGAATARLAARAGYRLVLAARSEGKLQQLARELGGDERAISVCCDVTEWSDQDSLVRWALDAYARIDVVFANAGFGGPRGFEQHEPALMRSMVLTNVLGVAYTIRATLPHLRETRGHLVLTGSVAGRRALKGSVYSATKFAVSAMGESARLDLNGTGVRVTTILPGQVETPFFDGPGAHERLEPQDVAAAVMYAVSQPERVDVNEVLIRPTAQEA